MVLALHLNVCRVSTGFPSCQLIRSLSGIAIPLFFMVSGFLMANKELSYKYILHKCLNILKVTVVICLAYDLFYFIKESRFFYSFPWCFIQEGDWWHFWYFGSMLILYLMTPLLGKLSQRSHRNVLIILFVVNILWWVVDILFQFEKNHITQTFRLWYFVFYFLLGSYLRLNPSKFQVHWYHVVASFIPYALCVFFLPAGGIEFHFGSPFCVLYTLALFVMTIGQHSVSPLFSKYSTLVLPVYCFHVFILNIFITPIIIPRIELLNINVNFIFLIEFITLASIVFFVALLLSKIPGYSKLFRL